MFAYTNDERDLAMVFDVLFLDSMDTLGDCAPNGLTVILSPSVGCEISCLFIFSDLPVASLHTSRDPRDNSATMLCQQRINARVVCTGRQQAMPAGLVRARVSRGSRVVVEARSNAFVQSSVVSRALAVANRGSRALRLVVSAVKDGAALDRPLRVAVIGGGPSGACAAETLAKGGVDTFLLERKLDNCKVTAAAMESRHSQHAAACNSSSVALTML